jgi:hypothetical protein
VELMIFIGSNTCHYQLFNDTKIEIEVNIDNGKLYFSIKKNSAGFKSVIFCISILFCLKNGQMAYRSIKNFFTTGSNI